MSKENNILIIGASGFAGSHLWERLENVGLGGRMYGTYFNNPKRYHRSYHVEKNRWSHLDLHKTKDIINLLEITRPNIIYHLASFVSVKRSWDMFSTVLNVNLIGTSNLFEAVKNVCPQASILVVGSNEIYGNVPVNKLPVRESNGPNPSNPYGLSKWFQEQLSLFYRENYGINVYLCRTFHYTGPNQPEGFVCSDFARQIAFVEIGKKTMMHVGNLKARRDFTDIRDVVEAYRLILDKGKPGFPYNICSGKSYSIQNILDLLVSNSTTRVQYEIAPSLYRQADVSEYRGDYSLLKADTGWEPKYGIEQTLTDTMESIRQEIRNGIVMEERKNR